MPRGRRDDSRDTTRKGQRDEARDAQRDSAPAAEPLLTAVAGGAVPDHASPVTTTPASPPQASEDAEAQALSAFFRELATRADRDPAFGAGLLSVAQASGLARLTQGEADALSIADDAAATQANMSPSATPSTANTSAAPLPASATPKRQRARSGGSAPIPAPTPTEPAQPAPDPFAVMRAQGEAGLRATLDAHDLPTLRQIVRAHRLDPARISARWANRDRVITLIVEQTRARLNHGRAFERV